MSSESEYSNAVTPVINQLPDDHPFAVPSNVPAALDLLRSGWLIFPVFPDTETHREHYEAKRDGLVNAVVRLQAERGDWANDLAYLREKLQSLAPPHPEAHDELRDGPRCPLLDERTDALLTEVVRRDLQLEEDEVPGKDNRDAWRELQTRFEYQGRDDQMPPYASTPEQVRQWWGTQCPEAAIGVRTGPRPEGSGLVVVRGEPNQIAQMESELGPLPQTLAAERPDGRVDLYFAHPAGPPVPTRRHWRYGVSVLSEESYTVAPPSTLVLLHRDFEKHSITWRDTDAHVLPLPEAWTQPLITGVVHAPAPHAAFAPLRSGGSALPNNSSDALHLADEFLRLQQTDRGQDTLTWWDGRWYRFGGRCWEEVAADNLRAEILSMLEKVDSPTVPRARSVLDHAKHRLLQHQPTIESPPCWLDGRQHPRIEDVMVMQNGVLDVNNRRLRLHTPALFTTQVLPFPYDRNAPVPETWLKFLRDQWADDPQSIDTLQEIFGYLLTADTSLQKIFVVIGPRRSGKGTIGRILEALLGEHNVAGPLLQDLNKQFGLQGLLGRTVAVISDMRINTSQSHHRTVQRLLSISGEDKVTVDRKHRTPWHGHLPTRFLMLSNELPGLHDPSGVLHSRYVLLKTTRSFYGKEDPALEDRLRAELPGILNWALAGLDRLRQRGHFVVPQSGLNCLDDIRRMESPIRTFVEERCELQPGAQVERSVLYESYRCWCDQEGRTPESRTKFGMVIKAMEGVSDPRHGSGKRAYLYTGIRLR